ncbi:hypothetical protein [Thermus caliditerrae]|uniref:hypothetical protein n=1 Tax=Thermus caliditerrae TaxID=1330700 RepID=UPI001F3B6ECA|nr:hypothetical protein [Thermus caliditerrae]
MNPALGGTGGCESHSPFTDSGSGLQYTPSPTSASPSVSKGNTTDLTITYTTQAPPNSAGLQITVDCPSCSSWQKSNINPLVCLYIGSGLPSSIPDTHLADCPQAVTR